jgi:hypothetical protein
MRVPWFNWRVSGSRDEAARIACAPRERTEDDISLALRLIPLYHVLLQVDDPRAPMRLWWPLDWRARLTATLGAERALQALCEASERGVAVLAVCPRELAEHYCDELARQSLPCGIEPA